MTGSYSFDARITILSRVETDSPGGVIKTWTNGIVLWASVVQMVKNMFISVQIMYDERYAQTTIYRIITRGKQNFDYESTRFSWNSPSQGVRILEPFETSRLPGSRHTNFTSILVRDITDLKEGPA